VISAPNGYDALRRVAECGRAIDLVLTDVVMPGMGGRELVVQLRANRPDLRVLYMSGYTNDEIVGNRVLQPDTYFLQKPFSGQELATAVRDGLPYSFEQQIVSSWVSCAASPPHPRPHSRREFRRPANRLLTVRPLRSTPLPTSLNLTPVGFSPSLEVLTCA
jgi:CheY-like chemotaxis protein